MIKSDEINEWNEWMKKNRSTNSRINKIEKNRVKDVHRNQSQTCFVREKRKNSWYGWIIFSI